MQPTHSRWRQRGQVHNRECAGQCPCVRMPGRAHSQLQHHPVAPGALPLEFRRCNLHDHRHSIQWLCRQDRLHLRGLRNRPTRTILRDSRSGDRNRTRLCQVTGDRLRKLFYRGGRIYGYSECLGCSWPAAGQRRAVFDCVGFPFALNYREQWEQSRSPENRTGNFLGFAYALRARLLVAYQAAHLALNSLPLLPGAAAFRNQNRLDGAERQQ